ncbi:2-keto-4-pentenoate hydratase [Nocardioides halotolerans]|uniref:2-keto-4-pentenoate hydratase n=1 Tax=Nocardioides halotolerans TaxID=433660 RepID=UPI000428C10B|nr:fumarylacetoacetate hydrolase family protein [Nocardioides halotolerans]
MTERHTEPEVVATLTALAGGAELDDAGAAVLAGSPVTDVADGARLQLEVLRRLEAGGAARGGWKIGWTSRGARDDAGADGARPFGYVLADRVLPSGSRLDLGAIPSCRLEPEIALVMGAALSGPDVTPEEARAAVRAVAPAFEVNSSRLRPGLSMAVRIGNSLNNWGIVVGPEQDPDLPLDALHVEMRADGEVVSSGSSGPDVLDDPFLSLSRVVATLTGHGIALEPGQTLITGSLTAPLPVSAGVTYEATFRPLGSVSVRC